MNPAPAWTAAVLLLETQPWEAVCLSWFLLKPELASSGRLEAARGSGCCWCSQGMSHSHPQEKGTFWDDPQRAGCPGAPL